MRSMALQRVAVDGVPIVLLLLLLLLQHPVIAIQHKCAACKAIAVELELALANERPRNDLDLRHRLDSKGQRQGRVIQYKSSELRAVELLEDLCTKMKDHTYDKSIDAWIKLDKGDGDHRRSEDGNALLMSCPKLRKNSLTEKQEAEAYSKDIASYCGRLVEKNEDKLTLTIKNGEMVAGSVEKILCEQLSKDCNTASRDEDGEL